MLDVNSADKKILKLAFNSNTFDEFETALQESNFRLSKDEAKELFEYVENDKKRVLSEEEIKKIAGGSEEYTPDFSDQEGHC